MKRSDFSSRSPGRLVPTSALQRHERKGVSELHPVTGLAFVPHPLPPSVKRYEFIGALSDDILSATAAVARLDATVTSIVNSRLLVRRSFAIREATLSSKIEDTIASAEEVALADADRPVERDEIQEVANCSRALEHGLATPLPSCKRLFRELHAILMSDARGGHLRPGEFRKSQVFIGGKGGFEHARFVPPPAGPEMNACLDALERFLNPSAKVGSGKERAVFPSIIEIAWAHYQFEAIHPFLDGNGRLGRLLAVLSLSALGTLSRPIIPISAYIDRHRRTYYGRLLRVSTHGEWGGWTRFFARAVASEADDAMHRTWRLHGLRQAYNARVHVKRRGPQLDRLLDLLFEKPAITAAQAAAALDTSFNTAQKHIERLASAGILTEHRSPGRGRVFLAREIVAIIEADRVGPTDTENEHVTIRTGD